MPEMDGFMLTERLRSTAALRETAIIMLTSGGRPGDIRRCEELRISAHLMKPVKQSELLEAINLALGSRRGIHRVRVDAGGAEIDPALLPPCKILLAEDGKSNQQLAVALLTKWGHEVTVAENGEEVIARWQEDFYDVILMDVQMPILDGLEATRRIREREEGSARHTPIVAMTARAMGGDHERCLAAGMDDYISKPIRKTELFRALSGCCPDRSVPPARGEGAQGDLVLDWDAALQTVGGDRELLHSVVNTVRQEMPVLLRQLDEAIAARDAKTTQHVAHTIKGECRTLSAGRTEKAAAAIEASAARNDLESASRHMPRLLEAIDQLDRECASIEAQG
jgi:CheY-like chemotaxis protein